MTKSWYTLKRPAARVVVLDPDGQIFMINGRDPADASKPHWWEIPGGGIDPGESSEDACRRELVEEAGITDVEIGPCVWVQHVEFDFGGIHFDSDERIHVAWAKERADYRPQGLEALEAMAFLGARWWPLDELLTESFPTLPERLREFLPALVAGDLPEEPIDIAPRP